MPSDYTRKDGKEIVQSQLTELVGENGKFFKEETHWHETEERAL